MVQSYLTQHSIVCEIWRLLLFLYLDLYANLDKPDASNIQTKPKSQKSQKHGIDDRKPLRSTTATIGHEKFGQEGELPKNTKVHTTYST